MQVKKTITIGAVEPITLLEAKTYLKVDYADEDSLISLLISSIRESMELFTGLSLIASDVVYFDEEIQGEIKLPFPDHLLITEVKINGSVVTEYLKTGASQFILSPFTTFAIGVVTEKGIKITYTTMGGCYPGLKLCMLKAIDESYRNRGNTFEGSISELSENSYSSAAKYCII